MYTSVEIAKHLGRPLNVLFTLCTAKEPLHSDGIIERYRAVQKQVLKIQQKWKRVDLSNMQGGQIEIGDFTIIYANRGVVGVYKDKMGAGGVCKAEDFIAALEKFWAEKFKGV